LKILSVGKALTIQVCGDIIDIEQVIVTNKDNILTPYVVITSEKGRYAHIQTHE